MAFTSWRVSKVFRIAGSVVWTTPNWSSVKEAATKWDRPLEGKKGCYNYRVLNLWCINKDYMFPEDPTSVVEFLGLSAARWPLPQLWLAAGLNQSLVWLLHNSLRLMIGEERLHTIFRRGLAPFLLLWSELYLTSTTRQVLFHNLSHAETFPDYWKFVQLIQQLYYSENWIWKVDWAFKPFSVYSIKKHCSLAHQPLLRHKQYFLQNHIYDPHLLTIFLDSSPLIWHNLSHQSIKHLTQEEDWSLHSEIQSRILKTGICSWHWDKQARKSCCAATSSLVYFKSL